MLESIENRAFFSIWAFFRFFDKIYLKAYKMPW